MLTFFYKNRLKPETCKERINFLPTLTTSKWPCPIPDQCYTGSDVSLKKRKKSADAS